MSSCPWPKFNPDSGHVRNLAKAGWIPNLKRLWIFYSFLFCCITTHHKHASLIPLHPVVLNEA